MRSFSGLGLVVLVTLALAVDPPGVAAQYSGGAWVTGGDFDDVVVGSGPGAGRVRVFTSGGVPHGGGFEPYPGFAGGVRVAACDLDKNGVKDIITAPGPGGAPHVRAIRLNPDYSPGVELASFLAYDPAYRGGVFLACGDVNGDGVPDIITGTDAGGGPHVRVFSRDPTASGGVVVLTEFMAYDPGFTGGVRVAAGDVDGSGRASIILAAGPGGGPHVRALKFVGGGFQELAGFMVYDPGFRGGVFVAAGDLDGDGRAEIVTGAGAGGGPHVRVYTGTGIDTGTSFFAYDLTITAGVHVGVIPGLRAIVTGPGSGNPHVRGFRPSGAPMQPQFIAPVGPRIQFAVPALPTATVGQARYEAHFCNPPVSGFTQACGPFPPTTNPTGGIPPYHFQLGSGGGFPPFNLFLGKDGQLCCSIANSTAPRNYPFVVCAIDLAGDSACGTAVVTVVAGAANPFQGSISGSWSGTCDQFPVSGGFSMTIDAAGQVTGSYSGDDSGPISGSVDVNGNLSASGTAGASTWTGTFTRTGNTLSGSGSWSQGAGCGGPWSGSGPASG